MNRLLRTSLYVSAALCAVLSGPPAAWAHSPEAGIRHCATIAADEDRLRCFDALAAGMTPAPPAATAAPPAAQAPAPTEPPATPETAAATTPSSPPAEQTTAPEPVAAAPVAAAPAATPEYEPISDDIGSERIQSDRERAETERQKYAARVTRCDEHERSGQYYFFFENGQVWKQANYQRLYWRDCEFDVTISKGKLGYDMHVPEKDRTVRVARIR